MIRIWREYENIPDRLLTEDRRAYLNFTHDENLKALCQACHHRYDAAKREASRKVYQRWDQENAGQMQLL